MANIVLASTFRLTINIYGHTALVLHDSEHQITDHGNESTLNMRRILHLVKVDEEWKIDLMSMYFMPHNPLVEEIEM